MLNSSSWSTLAIVRKSVWWLAHMIPICRKLAAYAPICGQDANNAAAND
nr:hypothetical protein [Fodinicola feengrottensis]